MFSNLSDPEKAFIACVPVVLCLGGMMLWNSWKVSGQERDKAIERCEAKEDPAACLAGVEERHDECFDLAMTGGGRYEPQYLDVRVYDDCVMGVEADSAKP